MGCSPLIPHSAPGTAFGSIIPFIMPPSAIIPPSVRDHLPYPLPSLTRHLRGYCMCAWCIECSGAPPIWGSLQIVLFWNSPPAPGWPPGAHAGAPPAPGGPPLIPSSPRLSAANYVDLDRKTLIINKSPWYSTECIGVPQILSSSSPSTGSACLGWVVCPLLCARATTHWPALQEDDDYQNVIDLVAFCTAWTGDDEYHLPHNISSFSNANICHVSQLT